MHAMHQTPISNNENSAPKAAAHAAHSQSHIVKLMSVGSPTFSCSQEPIKDEDSLHKGRKRKATTQAVQISPICQHEIENIHTTELPSPDGACQYVKDRLMGKITCMVCGKEGHYTCDCPMKNREEKVICTLCNKVGHCHLWCCRQNVSENHACHRCGEKGHYANKKLSHFGESCSHNREISCSSCDTNHLLGDCPMGKITCFLCEGKHHVPAQCRVSPILTIATQYHRESLRATLNKLMTETSSGTLTPVKPSGKLPQYEAVPKVSNFFSSNGQGHSARKNPRRRLVTDFDNTNHATIKNKATMLASKITCFTCHEEGHKSYACPKNCPKKGKSGEYVPHYEAVPKVSNFSSSNGQGHSAKKNPMRSQVTDSEKTNQATIKNEATMLASKITCFTCHEEGHKSYACPKNCPKKGKSG